MAQLKKFCAFVLFNLFWIAGMLVGLSFKTVQVDEYALKMNTFSKSVEANRVYTNGRYFVGLGRKFIAYPRTVQNIAFAYGGDAAPLDARLASGSVTVECSFQFSLMPEELHQLYTDYGTNYRNRFIYSASSTINNAFTANFNVTDFYSNRQLVKQVAKTALVAAFVEQHATVHDLQIRSVTLRTENENQIIAKLVSLQEQETALNLKTKNRIDTEAVVQQTIIQQEIDLLQTNQTQIAAVITETSKSQAKQIRMSAASQAYKSFQNTLGFNNTELMKYLHIKQLKTLPSDAVLVSGFDDVLGLVNNL